MKYCESTYKTVRRPTREVKVGKIGIGGTNPIRVQSMTTTNTRDVEGTVEQIIRLADVGCEIVRVTVQGIKEAESCESIKNLLLQKGYEIPLVADIHFYPPAAIRVADFVDKVRINPGNFADRRATFKNIIHDDRSYAEELQRIEQMFIPLVDKCKRLGRALRIGSNHGSLSDRIMSRYGDTPFGMVESAFEFARICRARGYHNFVFSMKASNPLVMIQAYRLLSSEMYKLGWDYPLHLGVTEAGEGEDGRIKSAIGIGSLLLDGLGDTIRVSLTEDPTQEIPVCREIIQAASKQQGVEPFEFHPTSRRKTVLPPSFHPDGTVIVDEPIPEGATLFTAPKERFFHSARRFFNQPSEQPTILSFDGDLIETAMVCGALLTDGLGEGVAVGSLAKGLSILQGARMRMSRTDYISCPGCGRTLFDLQSVTQRIRSRTAHLPGVKIAIMGCIVNGPGEMADADFGYVGSKTGKIDLYVGKTCVEKDIPFADADEKLISLIKLHGRWTDPV